MHLGAKHAAECGKHISLSDSFLLGYDEITRGSFNEREKSIFPDYAQNDSVRFPVAELRAPASLCRRRSRQPCGSPRRRTALFFLRCFNPYGVCPRSMTGVTAYVWLYIVWMHGRLANPRSAGIFMASRGRLICVCRAWTRVPKLRPVAAMIALPVFCYPAYRCAGRCFRRWLGGSRRTVCRGEFPLYSH